MKAEFSALMPVERQLILVASDDKYAALIGQIPWEKLLVLLPALFLPYRYLLPLLSIGVDELRNVLKRGEIPIPHLSPREAVNRFRFDHGHPLDGGAYIAHPVLQDRYLVPALANERLAQEKVAAFLDLTAALGAKKLEVVSAELLEKNKIADANLATEAARFGIDFSISSSADRMRKVFREFGRPDTPPQVPEHTKKWLEEDPIFRSVSFARLSAKGLTDQAQLRIENRLLINSSLTLGLERSGIQAGGKAKEVASSVFGFSIEYWPLSEK